MASQYVGVCYGNNWSPPDHVISLLKFLNIKKMRIYEPNQDVMKLLVGSGIVVILGVPYEDIERLAHIPDAAKNWVHDNVLPYIEGVSFRCIAVGNGVQPPDQAAPSVLPAMENINDALISFGLKNKVKVSTVIDSTILGDFQVPSQAEFRDDALIYIEPIIEFLVKTGAPLLANVHPYFAYAKHPCRFSLQFALFIPGEEIIRDGELAYKNLFDFLLDGIYFAVEKLPVPDIESLEIIVSESGWPYAGGPDANILSAIIYYKNLNGHVTAGTPKRPQSAIETYLSDENGNVGLFNPGGHAQKP